MMSERFVIVIDCDCDKRRLGCRRYYCAGGRSMGAG
jgi:hypothetical protein